MSDCTLKFERVLRHCAHNAAKQPGKRPIYDWEVHADGVHIATWNKIDHALGYRLYDLGGDLISGWSSKERAKNKARSKTDFEPITRILLSEIPSQEEVDRRRAKLAERIAEGESSRYEHERISRIKSAGVELRDALMLMIDAHPVVSTEKQINALKAAKAAIDLAYIGKE